MAKTFHLTIAKIGENIFDGEALVATLPGNEGVFEVLGGHEAFVSQLAEGVMRVTLPNNETRDFPVRTGGIAEVSNNQATVLL